MSLRLFVALDLPDEVRGALPDPGEGWWRIPPESVHVTLAFLGHRPQDELPEIEAAVAGAVSPVGELCLRHAIRLPPRRPRVTAIELGGDRDGLVRLQARVSAALATACLYVPEKRAYLPHVTIGRVRGEVTRDTPLPEVPGIAFAPATVTLYRSLLRRGGAVYEPLAAFPLPPGESAHS